LSPDDGDHGPIAVDVEVDVAVEVGDVEEFLEEVRGDVALTFQLRDRVADLLRLVVGTLGIRAAVRLPGLGGVLGHRGRRCHDRSGGVVRHIVGGQIVLRSGLRHGYSSYGRKLVAFTGIRIRRGRYRHGMWGGSGFSMEADRERRSR